MDVSFFLYVGLGLILLVAVVLILRNVPKKVYPVISILLLGVIGLLAYKNYQSIAGPVEFGKLKEKRYQQVVNQMIKIRQAQLAHKEITGDYQEDINKLATFVDTAEFALTVKRDTTIADEKKNRAFGLDPQTGGYYLEKVLVDTVGFKSIKDSLFSNTDVAQLLKYKFEGATNQIKLEVSEIQDDENFIPVFKATAYKKDILADQPDNFVRPELEVKAVEQIDGEAIIVGSLDEVSTSGNWPRQYAVQDEQ
jgi:apolipoprotein N-acyltransferase